MIISNTFLELLCLKLTCFQNKAKINKVKKILCTKKMTLVQQKNKNIKASLELETLIKLFALVNNCIIDGDEWLKDPL